MNDARKQHYRLLTSFSLAFFLLLVGCATKPPNIDIPAVAPKPRVIKNVEVALVLGGGGSRGITHVGVLEELEKEGVPIDLIVGTSAGSIIGALYADHPDAVVIRDKVINLKKKDLLDPAFSFLFSGPIQGNALEHFLVRSMRSKDFDELQIPLVAVATNVDNNDIVMLSSGPIAPAVHASSALPPLFSPVILYNQTLVDGGVIAPVPVQVAKHYKPKLIIAVDISTPPSRSQVSNILNLFYRSLHISFYELSRSQSTKADIFLHPNLSGFGTFDDDNNVGLYEKGKDTTRRAMKNIKLALKRRGIKLRTPEQREALRASGTQKDA